MPWARLSEFISERMGLHFPRERWDDLGRGLAGAAREFGLADAAACADRLLSAPPSPEQLQVLASHLTIGETYFFREKQTFQALAAHVLPELIGSRRGREQRLRIWSAGCCTGEEPYSLAILLHQVLPDLRDWQVTITATDINARFLHKAAAAVYGPWSFRDAPEGFQERYFRRTAEGRFAIIPEIKSLVTFAHLNLAEDAYPSLVTETNAMDLIFCRSVLMYFTPRQADKVIRNLHHALVQGGWLVVSPSEASHALFRQFVTVNYPGVNLYRKDDDAQREPGQPWISGALTEDVTSRVPETEALPAWTPPAPGVLPTEPETPPGTHAAAESLYGQGRYAEAAAMLVASFSRHAPEPPAISLLARALANQGDLAGALGWCDRWIAADKLDPAGHYLRAVVLLERGDPEQARGSLQRAVYLDPHFVLSHFALGNLARSRGRVAEARRNFANALNLLRRYRPDEALPHSEGLTAGRLTETIAAMTEMDAAA
jgi:chemotaxis protein methyltransferase CheR